MPSPITVIEIVIDETTLTNDFKCCFHLLIQVRFIKSTSNIRPHILRNNGILSKPFGIAFLAQLGGRLFRKRTINKLLLSCFQ